MANTVALFVGTDNVACIESIISQLFDGFTVIPASGYWHGVRESSVLVIISSDDNAAILCAAERLKTELHQESIAVERWPEMRFI